MGIFLTSDFHFCHNRDFVYKKRGFDSVDEMNKAIIENFKEMVGTDDETYVLGDLILNDNEKGLECVRALNGKLHIILGNHDTDERIRLYKKLPNVVDVSFGARLKLGKKHFYLSHYPTLTANPGDRAVTYNLCGHSHTTDRFVDFYKAPIYHVEVDAHNCYPVPLAQIKEEIKIKFESESFKAMIM